MGRRPGSAKGGQQEEEENEKGQETVRLGGGPR